MYSCYLEQVPEPNHESACANPLFVFAFRCLNANLALLLLILAIPVLSGTTGSTLVSPAMIILIMHIKTNDSGKVLATRSTTMAILA